MIALLATMLATIPVVSKNSRTIVTGSQVDAAMPRPQMPDRVQPDASMRPAPNLRSSGPAIRAAYYASGCGSGEEHSIGAGPAAQRRSCTECRPQGADERADVYEHAEPEQRPHDRQPRDRPPALLAGHGRTDIGESCGRASPEAPGGVALPGRRAIAMQSATEGKRGGVDHQGPYGAGRRLSTARRLRCPRAAPSLLRWRRGPGPWSAGRVRRRRA